MKSRLLFLNQVSVETGAPQSDPGFPKLLSREELKLWQFGRLAITSAIANQWLEKTMTDKVFQQRRR